MTRLSRLSRKVHEQSETQLRTVAMSYSEYAAMHILAMTGPDQPLSPSQLNQDLGLSSGGITKTVDRLESAGMVKRSPDPKDGRGVLVSLTSRGRRRANLIFQKGLEHYAELLESINSEERRGIARSLRMLLTALEPKSD